jgi:hypothetical protein
VERQQPKWFALATVLSAANLVGVLLSLDRPLGDALWNLLDAATNMALYVAVGVAILRYRLYEIDLLINRTLVYGLLTGTQAAIYFGGVATTQAIFQVLTGQEQPP